LLLGKADLRAQKQFQKVHDSALSSDHFSARFQNIFVPFIWFFEKTNAQKNYMHKSNYKQGNKKHKLFLSFSVANAETVGKHKQPSLMVDPERARGKDGTTGSAAAAADLTGLISSAPSIFIGASE
jgi:hypothetical protein